MDEGWELLEDVIARASERQQEAEAARGYRMIGSSASALVEYDRAERWLIEGIGYAENVELWNHRHYMASHLAHVQWATGQWDAAIQTAQQALADGRGGAPDLADQLPTAGVARGARIHRCQEPFWQGRQCMTLSDAQGQRERTCNRL
jgi:hypothetical protein